MRRARQAPDLANLDDNTLIRMYNYYKSLITRITRRHTFTIDWTDNTLTDLQRLFTLVMALLDTKKDPRRIIKLKITDNDGDDSYYTLNVDTIQYFKDILDRSDV